MAAAQIQADPDGVDGSLDRLEAALETIARGLDAPRAEQQRPAEPSALDEIDQRVDAAIDHVKAVLGRKSDP